MLIGGMGFIGKNIIELLNDRYEIIVIARKLDKDLIKNYKFKYYEYSFGENTGISKIIKKEQPNYIINLISIVNAERDLTLFDKLYESNIKVLLELYEAAKDLEDLELFIHIGSLEEYGNIKAPFNEKNREQPNSPYGIMKQATTNTALMLYKNCDFPIMILRLGNVFGKYQNKDKFIPYIVSNLLKNEKIDTTKCEQKRDYIYVIDLINILEKIIAKGKNLAGEIVNVSSGESYSLKEIIEFLRKELKSLSIIEYGKKEYRKNEIMDLKGNINKLKGNIEYEFKYDIYQGLKDYIRIMGEK